MSSDKEKEIEYLKKLVRYGDKLNINTLKYKKELNRLDKNIIITNQTKTTLSKKKYTITSVSQEQNSIIINFNHTINRAYIDFNEKKVGKLHFDEFLIRGNFKNAAPTKLKIDGIFRITIYQKRDNLLSIIFKDRRDLKTIYIINKNQIVIKVLDANIHKKQVQPVKKKTIKEKVKVIKQDILYPAKKIIVIDAGHGGHDSGATYKNKRYEKDITLKISKYLRDELRKKGYKVYLTRSRDKYIKLPHRTKYANKKHADMFISIHANAARKSSANRAHGVETYFLSPARSARAKRVAALENQGDMSGMGWSSKDSLLTILNRAKITAANKMAIDIQRNMLYSLRQKYGEKAIRDGGVREGPFWVLVGAQMPSVLVEVGYISHPKEGYRISTKRYQKIISAGIAQGVESYFLKNSY